MTRRSRRASSGPQRVGSDAGLTSTRPALPSEDEGDVASEGAAEQVEAPSSGTGRRAIEQTKDDTDEGWGERGEDDASARWLRENRPPHWS